MTQKIFEFGKSYVGIGLVDNSELLFGQYREGINNEPLKYTGIDLNPICIARCILIYKMMKQNKDTKAIFEVWYLSCLSKTTHKIVKDVL